MRLLPGLLPARAVVALALTAAIVSPALGQPAGTTIIPGHALGPVTLGMPATAAREVAARFERETGCGIDVLVARGVVIAAGTAWGACLNLQLPSGTRSLVVPAGPGFPPVITGIGGPPAALVDAFGPPLVVRRGADEAALIFANGLVANVGAMHAQGGVVTYLAVQSPGWRSVPRIGHFTDEANPRDR